MANHLCRIVCRWKIAGSRHPIILTTQFSINLLVKGKWDEHDDANRFISNILRC